MKYREPIMEVIVFEVKNIVCESNLETHPDGDGSSGSINDWL